MCMYTHAHILTFNIIGKGVIRILLSVVKSLLYSLLCSASGVNIIAVTNVIASYRYQLFTADSLRTQRASATTYCIYFNEKKKNRKIVATANDIVGP